LRSAAGVLATVLAIIEVAGPDEADYVQSNIISVVHKHDVSNMNMKRK